MRRLLFIDDCPQMLSSLEFALELQSHRWQCRFASSGAEALALMNDHAYDLIVTDLRMPGMHGEQLLEQIEKRYPATLRLVSSGHPHEAIRAKARGLAHMHLEKPYTASALVRAIERCLALYAEPTAVSPYARNLAIRNLPSSPLDYQNLVTALADPSINPSAIHRIINRDPAMAARVLQIVNTADDSAEPVTTVASAIERLGYESLRTLVAAKELFIRFAADGEAGALLLNLQRDACRAAVIAREIANFADASASLANKAYLAGLLLNIGKIAFLQNEPRDYHKIAVRHRNSDTDSLLKAERLRFGIDNTGLAAHLLSLWGFSQEIIDAIANHRQPLSAESQTLSLSAICHLAAAIGFGQEKWRERIDWNFLESSGFSRQQVELWADAVLDLAAA